MKFMKYSILLIFLLSFATLASGKDIVINTIDDANAEGVKIGVQSGTTSDFYAQDNLNQSTLMAYDSILLAEQALEAGDVHLIMGDKPVLDAWISDKSEYAVLDSFSEELFGLGVAEGQPDLLNALNAALDEIFNDATAHGYDAIYETHFDDLPAVYDDGSGSYAYPAIGDLVADGKLNAIIDLGELEFGTDPTYPPFEEKQTDGTYVGFDIDMMEEIALRFTAEYSTTIVATITDSDWDPIIPNLKAGEFDVILSAMTKTPERDLEIDFTRAYYGSIQAVVGPTNSTIDVAPISILPIFAALALVAVVVRRKY
ncbi:MAG: transporter substrate-binding domain-containing protein [Candidatus Heimdallarchaeota archaeon]|nr:transporter substrate-binding domain-containing protein [Candidatus Heimdallarchaeota archaeon]